MSDRIVQPARRHLSSDAKRNLLVEALSYGLSLSPNLAEVLAVLLTHDTEHDVRRLGYLLHPYRPPSNGAVYERVRSLRRMFGVDVIGGYEAISERCGKSNGVASGVRYWLTEGGRALCAEAIARSTSELQQALAKEAA